MTMKKFFQMISLAAVAALVCMISCTKADKSDQAESKGWTVSISASAGNDASSKALAVDAEGNNLVFTFKTTDNIYVYNKTKGKADPSALHPDQDGTKVNLVGTLSESYSEGDELVLCYNPEYIEGKGLRFSYANQTGDLGTVADFAKAAKTVSAEEASAEKLSGSVIFENLQSIFYLAFSSSVSIKRVIISTKKNKLIHTDMTCHEFGGVTTSKIVVTRGTPSPDPFYVALRNENKEADTYLFWVEDADGFVYKAEKEAPAGKIVDGKLYLTDLDLNPQSKLTVTENGTKVEPNEGPYGYVELGSLVATGTGIGQYFSWRNRKLQSLTLDNVHLINYDHTPIVSDGSTLFPLTIIGDNTIETDARHPGIAFCSHYIEDMPLFVKGTGYLTITASNSIGESGILDTYDKYSIRAVDGYTVTREDLGDNGNGTATWRYKIRPN